MTTKNDSDNTDRSTSRFRKVELRTWSDERFRALSPIPSCGQGLWFYLMTGPFTGPIPGLFSAGRAAMAEALNWEQEAFDKAFGEVFAQGMAKADWKARLVWVPNALKHNKPASPNVVRSWGVELGLIPECALKQEALGALKASIHALGEAYGKAFDETCPKPSGKPSPKTIGNQEQEQEQLKEKPPLPPKGGESDLPPEPEAKRKRRPSMVLTGEGMALFAEFWAAYPRKAAKPKAMEAFLRLAPTRELVDRMLPAIKAQGLSAKYRGSEKRFVPHPTSWLNAARWEDEVDANPETPSSLPSTGVQALLDRPSRPAWALEAGFRSIFEAENEGCYEHNAGQFRDGKRVASR